MEKNSSRNMDQASQTMIDNLYKNTGKTLAQWIAIVHKQSFEKHGEIINYLKKEHQFTHGFANLVAHKSRESADGSAPDSDELIAGQYAGKESLKAIYDQVLAIIKTFGQDIEIAPKKSYVSLRRKKQFATLSPATKTRFEIGLNLKGQQPEGILEAEKPKAMCSHKIKLNPEQEIDAEVLDWIKLAYQQAG